MLKVTKIYHVEPEKKNVSLALMVLLLLFSMGALLAPYFIHFIGDDYVQLWRIRNIVASPESAIEIFSPYWTDWYYRPLQNLWFLLNRLIFGLEPPGYYFLQIYCHLIVVSLVFLIARGLRLGRWVAFGVATLFAINGQHQLTVGWISSIGNILSIMFAMASFAAYLGYLRYPERKQYVSLTVLFAVFAMLSHEVGFVLPFLLLGLRLLWPISLPVNRLEKTAGTLIACLTILYLTIQIIRPNANLVVDNEFLSRLPAALTPAQISQFASAMLSRWFPISISTDLMPVSTPSWIFVSVLIALTILLFIRGNLATKIGLLWIILQFGFLFLVLWNHRPELFNSRHLYGAWVGLCFVVGGLLQSLYEFIEQKNSGCWHKNTYFGGMATILILFLIFQLGIIRSEQDAMLEHANQVEKSRLQLEEILPDPNRNNRLFAKRFILTPPYLPPVASVWFDTPDLAGGSLVALKNQHDVNNQDYVLDYEDGVLYNLLPELQQSRHTYLLWRQPPLSAMLLYESDSRPLNNEELQMDELVKRTGRNRFGIVVQPGETGWASLLYEVTIPEDSQLAFGLFPSPKQSYRVRAVDSEGESQILYSLKATAEATEWLDVYLPLSEYQGEAVDLYFEYQAHPNAKAQGFWANPRLVME